MDRKSFLKISGKLSIASLLFAKNILAESKKKIQQKINTKTDGSMIGFKAEPIKKVKIAIIGLGNRGYSLLHSLRFLIENKQVEIVALSDIIPKKVKKAEAVLKKWQKAKPVSYSKDEKDWKKTAKQDNVDMLLIATPWRYHAEMCIYGMQKGKHIACEVPIALTMKECWEIVKVSEKTRKHCIMLENCCYGYEELFVLNLIEKGVFGELTHAEGAYIHDLRQLLVSKTYYEDQWRIKHHVEKDGNFYTTHGLGPIAYYFRIGRGDTFSHLTSMSSLEKSLSEYAKKKKSSYTDIKCGDMNTTLIKTALGKTIMLQFDVHTGGPYSRINKVQGTKGLHQGYPSRLYIDGKGHSFISRAEYMKYYNKCKNPILKKIESISSKYKVGHGGMDFFMLYRLIDCLNQGIALDMNVYDGVMWSAITPLSILSVANKSMSIDFPDFTNGKWKTHQDLEIMRRI